MSITVYNSEIYIVLQNHIMASTCVSVSYWIVSINIVCIKCIVFKIKVVMNIIRQKRKEMYSILLLYHIIDKCIYSCPPCNNDMKVIMK